MKALFTTKLLIYYYFGMMFFGVSHEMESTKVIYAFATHYYCQGDRQTKLDVPFRRMLLLIVGSTNFIRGREIRFSDSNEKWIDRRNNHCDCGSRFREKKKRRKWQIIHLNSTKWKRNKSQTHRHKDKNEFVRSLSLSFSRCPEYVN